MKDHAVVLESEATGELGVRGHFFLVDLAVRQHLIDALGEHVGVGDVTFVEFEMHLECLVRDACQSGEIECFWFVDIRFHAF